MTDDLKARDDPNEATPYLATPDNSHNCTVLSTLPLAFTVITSIKPSRLTKIIGINADGSMRKETSAMLSRGQAQRAVVVDLHELQAQLDALTSAQAVTWGVTKDDSVAVCTQADTEAQVACAIARTRDNFKFRAAPGVMMLDHDGLPDGELSPLQFRDRLIAAAPALAGAPMLWRPSVSAGCIGPDGRTLSGLSRHRLYIPVVDATLIPEAGKALEALLWATPGAGWCEVGAAGQRLPRCLVDVSVWQPERLDFAGPSVLVDGVTRAGVDGVIYGNAAAQFNLRLLIDSATPSIKKQAQAGLKAARAAVAEKCETARRNWVADKAPALAQRRGIKLAQATNVLERAAVHQVLMGDFELTCADGQMVTVAQLLDNPHRWHNTRFTDPLDPDSDRRVAVARLLNGTRPDLFSHRHGGMRYELRRQSARVQLGRGMRVDSTDAVLQVLRDRSELFDFGTNAIAFVADGKATPVSRDWLVDHAGRVAEFYSVKTERDDEGNITSTREIPEDAPTYIANAIIAKHGSRNFRKLTAVTTAPTLRPDGSVLDEPGHDLVRQPLCWLRERMLESGRDLTDLPMFVDPADSIDRAASENPETSKLAALLNAWIATFGTTPTSPAQAITKATEVFGAQSVLFDALDEIAGQNSKLNVRILGRWLERHAGQLCTGLRLVLANKTNCLKRWTVVRTVERAATDNATPPVARVAPSCEIQDVDDSGGPTVNARADQFDDVEIF